MDFDDFQRTIAARYGDADRARGVAAAVAWLTEEVGELAQSARKGSTEDQRRELGDVLAWLASLADQLGVTLGDAARHHLESNRPPSP